MEKRKLISQMTLLFISLLLLAAAATHPQLSVDEQTFIIDSVIQTINPQVISDSIAATLDTKYAAKIANLEFQVATLNAAMGIQNELINRQASEFEQTPMPTPTAASVYITSTSAPKIAHDGLHAKFVNSYAYTKGEDSEDGKKEFKSVYIPNQWFTVDVVFENDGSITWPTQIEMRNISTSGEYTGASPNAVIDRTNNPVKPGDRASFSISAFGSENLGTHTFYFQLFDYLGHSVIAGGSGSFTYTSE